MSREIKFRAWHKTLEGMYDDGWHGKCVGESGANSTNDHLRFLQDHDMVLMQYTGLKDKNGVEIYEGDIVRMPADLWVGDESVGKAKGTFRDDAFVEYVNGSFRLNKLGDESKNYYGVLNYSRNNYSEVLEVIGNIYQNPELLTTIGE